MPPERSRQLIGNVWRYVTAATSGGGGGSQPVSCVIQTQLQDLASASTYYVLYGTDGVIIDNWVEQNELLALPAGIGLQLNSDNLTTTEAGVWAFTLAYVIPFDATWDGNVQLDNFSRVRRLYTNQTAGADPVGPVTKADSLCEVIALPVGAQFATRIDTVSPATGMTLNAGFDLAIVRLA